VVLRSVPSVAWVRFSVGTLCCAVVLAEAPWCDARARRPPGPGCSARRRASSVQSSVWVSQACSVCTTPRQNLHIFSENGSPVVEPPELVELCG